MMVFTHNSLSFSSAYIGTTLGETGNKHTQSSLGVNDADIRYQGFSGRYFVGADLSKYFGAEIGWLHVHDIGVLNINNTDKNGAINVNGYSFLIKFSTEMTPTETFTLKFGATFVRALPDSTVRSFSKNHYSRFSVSHWRPTVEFGLNRRFFKSIDLGVSFHYVPAHRAIPSITLFGFNLILILDKRFF